MSESPPGKGEKTFDWWNDVEETFEESQIQGNCRGKVDRQGKVEIQHEILLTPIEAVRSSEDKGYKNELTTDDASSNVPVVSVQQLNWRDDTGKSNIETPTKGPPERELGARPKEFPLKTRSDKKSKERGIKDASKSNIKSEEKWDHQSSDQKLEKALDVDLQWKLAGLSITEGPISGGEGSLPKKLKKENEGNQDKSSDNTIKDDNNREQKLQQENANLGRVPNREQKAGTMEEKLPVVSVQQLESQRGIQVTADNENKDMFSSPAIVRAIFLAKSLGLSLSFSESPKLFELEKFLADADLEPCYESYAAAASRPGLQNRSNRGQGPNRPPPSPMVLSDVGLGPPPDLLQFFEVKLLVGDYSFPGWGWTPEEAQNKAALVALAVLAEKKEQDGEDGGQPQ